jgi:hypothetical protein
MKTITKDTILEYGTFEDRIDSFDDNSESKVFVKFLNTKYPDTCKIVEKPFGKYGVDIGVYCGDKFGCAFDLERCKTWKDDWPSNWKCLSFLDRKSKYLEYPEFGMVWFNNNLSKFTIAWKKDILKFPVSNRNLPNGQIDRVRKVDFKYGKLYGSSFNPIEVEKFINRKEYDLK